MDLINHRSDKEALEDRLKIFCNRWGMLWEDRVKAISGLLLGFSMMKDHIQKGKLPTSKFNALNPGTKLSYQFRDGKVLPTFEAQDFFEVELDEKFLDFISASRNGTQKVSSFSIF